MQMGLPRIVKQLEIVGQEVAGTEAYATRFEELIAHHSEPAKAFARATREEFVADGDLELLHQRQIEAVSLQHGGGE